MKGFVRSLQGEKRFGFIRSPGARDDFFFHKEDFNGDWNQLVMDFKNGEIEVEFESVKSPKGPRAALVVRV